MSIESMRSMSRKPIWIPLLLSKSGSHHWLSHKTITHLYLNANGNVTDYCRPNGCQLLDA